MATIPPHPDSTLFPTMSDKDFQDLKADIKARGLLNPIVMYEGKILDGRHRYKACLELGIEPKFTTFTNTVISALDYVISQNLMRRHLTVGQRAAIAVTYKEIFEKQNKAKKAAYCKEHKRGTNPNFKAKGVNPETHSDIASARIFNISPRSVSSACKVKKENLSLFKEVIEGRMKLNSAYKRVGGRSTVSQVDRIARRIVNQLDFTNYKPPESVHCSDYEAWEFDRYMKSLGFSMCLNRVGDMFEAVYTKTNDKISLGHLSFKAAILSAGKSALLKLQEASK